MTLPFELEGFHIRPLPTGPDLMVDPHAIQHLARASSPAQWAILHTELFGAAASSDLHGELQRIRAAGGAVIVDATHRWPLPPHTQGDYLVASLRKFTALPDGAAVRGGRIGLPGGPSPHARSAIDDDATAAWQVGDQDLAEELMDRQLTPVEMSQESRRTLAALDRVGMVRARQEVGRVLQDYLAARGITPLSPSDAHFCAAFRHRAGARAADALVRTLSAAGVDGPVWWQRPGNTPERWPDDVVTLPVDGDPEQLTPLLRHLMP